MGRSSSPSLGIPVAILAEALAYIGIGVSLARLVGSLISEGQKFIRSEPHLVVFPAVFSPR
jgi:ABC-type dipeptide/oligopeptide/nickel transport system permease subunit